MNEHSTCSVDDRRCSSCCATGVSLSADRVKLRSGKVIEGMFIGGDSKSVRVLLDDGQVSEVPIADAVARRVLGAQAGATAGSETGRPSQPRQRPAAPPPPPRSGRPCPPARH